MLAGPRFPKPWLRMAADQVTPVNTVTRVFILGAGASRFAGYLLSLDLWPFIRDSFRAEASAIQRADHVTRAMNQVLKAIPPRDFGRPNLEELFTLLDLADMGTEPVALRDIGWRDVRPKLMGMISDAFTWKQCQFQSEASTNQRIVLGKWTDFLAETDTIISFNWDILREAALSRAGKWHYADGYGFRCSDALSGEHSGIKILKLHGSVNWAQEDERDCQPAVEHKADFFQGANDAPEIYLKAACLSNKGRNLIIPSYLKDFSGNKLLLHLWSQASEALINASEVTVIGFNLSAADAPARQLIGSALLENKQVARISVVSPWDSVSPWNKFCRNLGIRREFIDQKFEDWILRD